MGPGCRSVRTIWQEGAEVTVGHNATLQHPMNGFVRALWQQCADDGEAPRIVGLTASYAAVAIAGSFPNRIPVGLS